MLMQSKQVKTKSSLKEKIKDKNFKKVYGPVSILQNRAYIHRVLTSLF